MFIPENYRSNGAQIELIRDDTVNALGSLAVQYHLPDDTATQLIGVLERLYVPELVDGTITSAGHLSEDGIPILGLIPGESVKVGVDLLGFSLVQSTRMERNLASWRRKTTTKKIEDATDIHMNLITFARKQDDGQVIEFPTDEAVDSLVWATHMPAKFVLANYPGYKGSENRIITGRPFIVMCERLLALRGRASAALVHTAAHVTQLEKRPAGPTENRLCYLLTHEMRAHQLGALYGQAAQADPNSPFAADAFILRDAEVEAVRAEISYLSPYTNSREIMEAFDAKGLDVLDHLR